MMRDDRPCILIEQTQSRAGSGKTLEENAALWNAGLSYNL
jgi:hypothetical protein